MKFAWYSCSDSKFDSQYPDNIDIYSGFHTNLDTFEKAWEQVSSLHFKRMMDWWQVKPSDVDFVGSPPFCAETPFLDKILTKEEFKQHVLKYGYCQVRSEFKGDDPKKKGCRQEFFRIDTMANFKKEQKELEKSMMEMAQEEADRTGKQQTVCNLGGKQVTALPKVKKSKAKK